MRTVLAVLVLLIGWTSTAVADLEETKSRFEKGEFEAAFRSYQILAERGETEADFMLACILDHGLGTPADHDAAVELYRIAAEKGHPDAQFNIGEILFNGDGKPQDRKNGFAWLKRAADQGLADAELIVGAEYEVFGNNPEKALRYYNSVAEKGLVSGRLSVGFLLANGKGVKRQPRKAMTLIHAAAEEGHFHAQHVLAKIYM